jgi:Flp pilus assembly pilin Flp
MDESLKKTLGGVWTKIKNVFVNANPVFSGFAKAMIYGIKNGFSWELLKNTIKNVWSNIKNTFVNSHPIFSGIAKGMLDGIKNGFSWELLKNTIKNIWTNIKNSFSNAHPAFAIIGKNMLNGIKEKLTGTALKTALTKPFKYAINAVITLFNNMIYAINKALKFSWDDFKIAGKTVIDKGSITIAKLPDVPLLAKGTVIPANYGNFMSIMGDAKVPEVVSPIDTMAEVFDNVLKKYIDKMAGNGQSVIYIGEREVFQVVREQAKLYEKQTNKKPW